MNELIDMSVENWKDIPGYEGYYEVSNFGNINSLHTDDLLKPFKGAKGYYQVWLCKNGNKEKFYVHRLVLTTFVGPCPVEQEARHFPDRNKSNNRLDNLSWGTCTENSNDKKVHGTSNCGSRNGQSWLDEEDVLEIRAGHAEGRSAKFLADVFEVSISRINKIVSRSEWTHI